jgi:hypothetical protein
LLLLLQLPVFNDPNLKAAFLALIHQINVEIQLINTDFPSNVSIAIEHAENTASVIFNSFLLLTSVVLIEFMIALTLLLELKEQSQNLPQ